MTDEPEEQRRWPVDRDRQDTFTWSLETVLGDAQTRVLPRIPFRAETCGPAAASPGSAGVADLRFDTTYRVNAVPVHRAILETDILDDTSPGCGGAVHGTFSGPDGSDVDAGPFRKGPNTIQVVTVVTMDVHKSGGGAFEFRLGPAQFTIYDLDRAGDGVRDAVQPLPEVHVGLTGAGLGLVAAVGIGFGRERIGAFRWLGWSGGQGPGE